MLAAQNPGPAGAFDPRYLGYFECFNRGEYYEAHDVLEDLWLETTGQERAFYKGLIQLAGVFVHLQKQALRPFHPKDGRRLAPASRLFALAEANLAPYRPRHQGLDLETVLRLCSQHRLNIIQSNYTDNPLNSGQAPEIKPAADCAPR